MNVMVCPDTGWSGSSMVATLSNFLFEVGSLINTEKVDKRRVILSSFLTPTGMMKPPLRLSMAQSSAGTSRAL